MSIFQTLTQAVAPGQRVIRVAGWEGLKKLSLPRDSEVIALDVDDTKDIFYMKKVDTLGNEVCGRYKFTEYPVEEFEPDKYVTKKDFDEFREEIRSGFDSIRQQRSADGQSGGAGKRTGQSDHGLAESGAGVSANGRPKS